MRTLTPTLPPLVRLGGSGRCSEILYREGYADNFVFGLRLIPTLVRRYFYLIFLPIFTYFAFVYGL